MWQSPGERFSGLEQGDGREDGGQNHRASDGLNMEGEKERRRVQNDSPFSA